MKKNKSMRYSLALLAILGLGATSCSKKFGDTNVSPNSSTTPVTSALLTSVETYVAGDALGSPTGTNTSPITGYYAPYFVQYFSQVQYPDNQLYPTTGVSWDGYYVGPLEDLVSIINVNTATPNPTANGGNSVNQIQIARILKAYFFAILTDKYGDIPYSQALKGTVAVPYDKQQAIYTDLFKELREAIAGFQSTGNAITGDIIYGGDISKWKRFANSLRMELAMQLSKVDPATGKTEFMAALNDANGCISDNTYNFNVVYPGGTFNFPYYNLTGASIVAISQTLADKMNGYNDPRVLVYGQKNASGKVKGVPYGLDRASVQAYIVNNTDWSQAFDASFKKNSSTAYIFTAAFTDLLRAEAAITYSTGESAYTMLQKSVTDSWAQWGVTGTVSTYLSAIGVTSSSVPVAKIQEQEWIALYGSSGYAYNEWRRTGVPSLTPAPGATNPSKTIPRRWPYPTTEANINGAAYTAAVSAMPYGTGDNETNRVWWDKP